MVCLSGASGSRLVKRHGPTQNGNPAPHFRGLAVPGPDRRTDRGVALACAQPKIGAPGLGALGLARSCDGFGSTVTPSTRK